jgi:DNA-binding GntR family transcriptional regulator
MTRPRLSALRSQESLTEQVRASVRDAIVSGELEPGSLHSVQSLADKLRVSRTPVREALIELANQGMVRFERNRGVRILQMSIHDLEEIFSLRLLLEVPAAHRGTTRMTGDVARAMRHELVEMERAAAADDEATLMRHDRRFHKLLNRAAGNERLAEFVDSLRDQTLTRGVSTVGRSRSLDQIVAEHHEILSAVDARDADSAARAMRGHIANTAELLLRQETGRDDVEAPWDGSLVWLPDGDATETEAGAPARAGA